MDRGDITDANKAVIFEKIAQVDNDLMEGADEYLQLLDLACILMKHVK
jgi:DNA polymerase III delta prime subunit